MPLTISGRCRSLLLLLVVALLAPRPCAGESATCLAVYREGGAPAVFQSAHCPRWTLLPGGGGDGVQRSSSPPPPRGCHVAAYRGRRRSQEDRAVCALGIRIPFIASWKCSEESFAHQVKIRDPLKMGFPNLWALRLARQLLVWHPEDRLSVDEALKHPYFQERP